MQIVAALAKLPELAGGNSFTGNQTITWTLTVAGAGSFTASVPGAGQILSIRNTAASGNAVAELQLGNDVDPRLLILDATASTYPPVSYLLANCGLIYAGGAGGMSIVTTGTGNLRLYTNNAERLRIPASGEVLINTSTNPNGGQLVIFSDASARPNTIVLQNVSATLTNFLAFINSGGGVAGLISQASQTTVAYNTASDARLKDDAGRATDLSALRGVVVHDFTWKADGVRARGVFAQEAYDVFPLAVSKGDDKTTDDGVLTHPWMTDYSKFVPDLIVGWQQHEAELAALRAELKGRH